MPAETGILLPNTPAGVLPRPTSFVEDEEEWNELLRREHVDIRKRAGPKPTTKTVWKTKTVQTKATTVTTSWETEQDSTIVTSTTTSTMYEGASKTETVTSTTTQLRQVETVTAPPDSGNGAAAGGMSQSGKVGAGVGGAIGGLALLFGVIWIWKRKKNRETMSYNNGRMGNGFHNLSSTGLQLSEMRDGNSGGHHAQVSMGGAPPAAYMPGQSYGQEAQSYGYEGHGMVAQSSMSTSPSPVSAMPGVDAMSIMSTTPVQAYASTHLMGGNEGFNAQQQHWVGTPVFASPTPPPSTPNGPYQAYSPLGPLSGPVEMPAESVPREIYEMPAR
jgi:hypothetical protein